jgi:hypothetical protein
MDADAELDAALLRQAGVALDHAVLHLDGAAHGVDHAAEFDKNSIARALDHSPAMNRDHGIDQVAAQRAQPRQRAVFVRAGQPAISGHVRSENRRKFPSLAHGAPLGNIQTGAKDRPCLQLSAFTFRENAAGSCLSPKFSEN